MRLRDLTGCFEGMIPSSIASCAPDGTPNVTWLSIVHRVDDVHVALSFQFFNKTRANVLANPHVQVIVSDAYTMRQYRLDAVYDHTEAEGPMFERVRTQLEAIASQTGMSGVFHLCGLDVYRVTKVEPVATEHEVASPLPQAHIERIADFGARLAQAADLDALVTTALTALDTLFAYSHAFLLAVAEDELSLFTLGSRGFEASGVGSDVRMGEGLIGVAAQARVPVRVTSMARQQVYARAVQARMTGGAGAREIPLPGLDVVQSQLAMPLVAAGRLVGVLCLQDARPGRFQAVDEQVVAIAGGHLAAAMLALSTDHSVEAEVVATASEGVMRIRYFASDDSVFVDDAYLIKGVAGRILWRLLEEFEARGRVDFSNRELRADPRLRLPAHRDNLEARLLLLRKRLDEQCSSLRLLSTGRGKLRLAVTRELVLEAVDGG